MKTCSLRLRAFTPGLTPGVLSPIFDSIALHIDLVVLDDGIFAEGVSKLLIPYKALVGFQGRGCVEGVQLDFCHALFLEVLTFP